MPPISYHPGRAALISGSKRQQISPNIPITTRSIAVNLASSSSPNFNNIEHIRSYSLSRTHSEQSSYMPSGLHVPLTNRRTSLSDVKEKARRGTSQMSREPKSLREWHEQPVNLLEQPFVFDNVNIQILSQNSERAQPVFLRQNDDTNESSKSEENLNADIEKDDNQTIRTSDSNDNK